ncbi:Aminotransferase class IV [Arabidopsis thaliana x Arabidopsis arenosa]|uniref:Aminotransferase class IV n=1 Tax=Arabidopsis thaliana x Arabidopsis arenosa TaxID=1240361 RepID=A0A8T2ATG4_9BRAS|nr:Aminotransferase class IV [Arabidopsis thaliana x Arabidopsis arenosa]
MAPSAQPLPMSVSDEKYANVKWEELAFGFVRTDYMYVAKCNHGESFQEGKILPFADLQLNPCAAVLQYGQGLYEGLKAYRTEDGRILLFRPDQNGLRIQAGADRLYMPYPSVDQFVSAIKQVALANKKWIPPPGKGTLYIRPILFGSGPILGSFPIPETTFTAFACPVGRYHKDNSGLNLKIEDKFRRAFPSGTGGVKSITNYSPVWIPLAEAKKQGFSDILFLDAATGKNVEELFAANIFMLKGNVVSTPTIAGTILPGVTRNCVMELCRDFGYQVEERVIPLEDFLDADETFCTGTASIVTSIASVTFKDKKTAFKTGEETLAAKLYETLNDIQTGRVEDTKGWTVEIDRYHQG